MKNTCCKPVFRTTAIAAAVGIVGVVVGSAFTRAQPHAQEHSGHAGVREHYTMLQGEQGVQMAKDAMLKMAAHQFLLGQAATDPELQKLAQSPELKKAIEEVRNSLKDQATLDAKKAELLKDHDEMMMILAHALLKQDAEAARILKDAESGTATGGTGGAGGQDHAGHH